MIRYKYYIVSYHKYRMKRIFFILLFSDVIACVLLYFLTGTFMDTLTMLLTSVFVCFAGVALSCIFNLVKPLKRFAFPMLLNSMILPFLIYVNFEISSSCQLHNHYVMYDFDTPNGEYQICIHKATNVFNINRTFDGGSEGVVHGTYISFCGNKYKLYVSHASSYNDKYNELLIKNDSIHGFNGSSYPLVHE